MDGSVSVKYHKKLGFEHIKLLELFILTVNKQYKTLSNHAKIRILERIDYIEKIGVFIRDYKIKFDDIIEYTLNRGNIEKVLVRAEFSQDDDMIISISCDANILTCYLNKKSDNHYTLNPNNYV